MSDWFERFGFAPVARGLLTGAYPADDADVAELAAAGVQDIVNLCEDAEYEPGTRAALVQALAAAGIDERRIELVDHGSLPQPELGRAVAEVVSLLEEDRRVYLHCRAGWQRSAAVAAGVIALREHVGIEAALARLRERKPSAEPMPHQEAHLLAWFERR